MPPRDPSIEVAGGGYHCLERRSDGVIVAWGRNDAGQLEVPALEPGRTVFSIACGDFHNLALYGPSTDAASAIVSV